MLISIGVVLFSFISFYIYNSIYFSSFFIAKTSTFLFPLISPTSNRKWESEDIFYIRKLVENDYIQYNSSVINIQNIPLSKNDHRNAQEYYINEKVLYRIYSPINSSNEDVLLWFHGGGFVIGNIRTEDQLCHDISINSKKIVVNVNYALSPENKFPIAINDSLNALAWVYENIHKYGGNKNNIFLGGESAGGNLAIGMFQNIKIPIKGIISIYPPLKLFSFTDSYWNYANYNGLLTLDSILKVYNLYLNNIIEESQHTLASPLLLSDDILEKYPKILIILAKYDILYDEGKMMFNKLKELKVNVILKEYNDIHGFFNRFGYGKNALNDVYNFLK